MAAPPVLLLVERPTDLAFVQQLLAATPTTQVAVERTSQSTLGGIAAVRQRLLATLQSPAFQADIDKIVVLRDCDDDAAAYFAETATAFADLGLPKPAVPFELQRGVCRQRTRCGSSECVRSCPQQSRPSSSASFSTFTAPRPLWAGHSWRWSMGNSPFKWRWQPALTQSTLFSGMCRCCLLPPNSPSSSGPLARPMRLPRFPFSLSSRG